MKEDKSNKNLFAKNGSTSNVAFLVLQPILHILLGRYNCIPYSRHIKLKEKRNNIHMLLTKNFISLLNGKNSRVLTLPQDLDLLEGDH